MKWTKSGKVIKHTGSYEKCNWAGYPDDDNPDKTEPNENTQPLLIVEYAQTKVKKATVSLNVSIKIKTDVSINTCISQLNSFPDETIKNLMGSGVQYRDTEGNLRTGVNRGEIGSTEDWKNNNVAITESGDLIAYTIVITNHTNEDMATTLSITIPDTVGGYSELMPPNALGLTGSETTSKYKIDEVEVVNNIWKDKTSPQNSTNQEDHANYVTWIDESEKTLSGRDLPDSNSEYISIPKGGQRIYRITARVTTARGSYDPLAPKTHIAQITGTYREDVSSTSRYYHAPIWNNSEQKISKDYHICKKYNVSVEKYISSVKRADGSATVSGEYLVDPIVDTTTNTEVRYSPGSARAGKTNDAKKANPIYIENGDIVTYTIVVRNAASPSDPYYSPQVVTIDLTDSLPLGANSELYDNITISGGTDLICSPKGTTGNLSIRFKNTSGQTTTLTCKVKVNKDSSQEYNYDERTNTVNITNVTNYNGKTTSSGCIVNTATQLTSSDYFHIKEYNVVIDKYITNVSHKESRGGTTTTYDSEGRRKVITDPTYDTDRKITNKGGSDSTENSSSGEVSVEYGDRVTYKLLIYNTTDNSTYYNVGRGSAPYKSPQNVYVDIKDTLPAKYSDLTVQIGATSQSLTDDNFKEDEEDEVDNGILYLNDVEVPAGSITTITVTLTVEEVTKDTIVTNTARIYNPVRNINQYKIVNNGNRDSAFDKYKLNDYNVRLDEYVSSYDAAMEQYNIEHNFISGEDSGAFNNGTEENNSYTHTYTDDVESSPLDVEKYETLTFATKVTNNAISDEAESESSTYVKYNTRVRPTEVKQTIDQGLDVIGFKVVWYAADGTEKEVTKNEDNTNNGEITEAINVTTETENQKNIYTYTLQDEESYNDTNNTKEDRLRQVNYSNIILSPGECLVYYTTVKVTESNMYLGTLNSTSEIVTLTNVNRNITQSPSAPYHGITVTSDTKNTRIVTSENIESKTQDLDYVRLKDLVIAGTVWLDSDRNGDKNDESGKPNVKVNLYGNTKDKQDEFEIKTSTYTDSNGFYTFGRQLKSFTKDEHGNYTSSEYVQYYVEFEYDGAIYKATEVYGGDNDGTADGMQNLNAEGGGEQWRQGYSDLPGTTSGSEAYKTDSNAYEFDDVRNTFDRDYQTIGYNKTYNAGKTLSYTKNGYTSTLNENTDRVMTARSFIKQDYNTATGITKSMENTNTLFLQNDENKEGRSTGFSFNESEEFTYNGHYNTYPETEYLKFINLGLVTREQVDISIESDVYSVKTTINGEEMTYDFNENDADSTALDYNQQRNAYKLAQVYNLNLYKADYNYRNNDYYKDKGDLVSWKGNESELTTEVTYRISIHNNAIEDEPYLPSGKQDIPIETAINEIAIYYDKNFVKIDNTTKKGEVTVKDKNSTTGLLYDNTIPNISVKYGTETELTNLSTDCIQMESIYGNYQSNNTNYNVLYLRGSALDEVYIPEGEERIVEITFLIAKDSNRNLKIKNENMGLEMISEISAYTTRYKPNSDADKKDGYAHQGLAGQYAGLIDRDSNPGNLGIDNNNESTSIINKGYYEDDTYRVGIKMQTFDDTDDPDKPNDPVSGKRNVTGFVWDDARSETIGEYTSGIQYLGNGTYDEKDESADDAKTNPNNSNTGQSEETDTDEDMDAEEEEEKAYDKPIEGVKVSLIEVVQTEDGKYYEYPARYTYDVKDKNGVTIPGKEKGNLIETTTDSDGEYTLSNFIPGFYKVRFDYGWNVEDENSIIYNGQDYKSTTYYNQDEEGELLYYEIGQGYNEKDYIGSEEENNLSYFDKVKTALVTENKSDAQDDEIRRLNVNSYSETMTTKQAVVFSETSVTKKEALEEITDNDEKKYAEEYLEGNDKKLVDNTKMYAESTIFYTKPEQVNSADEHITANTSNIIDTTKPNLTEKEEEIKSTANFDNSRLWNIHNLDFGLEYRPEASIILEKDISTVELVTSDNKTLVKLYFKDSEDEEDENGNPIRVIDENKSKGYENVQFIPNKVKTTDSTTDDTTETGDVETDSEKNIQGFVYINMDTEILQGCTIKAEYELDAVNNSEVDRINKNLDAIKYENDAAIEENYPKGVYVDNNYNANGTAAQLLASKYYVGYDDTNETFQYLKELKKPYKLSSDSKELTTTIENKITYSGGTEKTTKVDLVGQGYYGMYLGETYYTGKIGGNDIVAELKVDHILDYIDNDFTFSLGDNSKKDGLWKTTTSDELKGMLDWSKVNLEKDEDGTIQDNLIDRDGIRYDTENRSNLALSVNSGKSENLSESKETSINSSLSRFLKTKKIIMEKEENYTGTISIATSKILSAEDINEGRGLTYENIAEVIQYTSLTGRRTTLPDDDGNGGVIANVNVSDKWGVLTSEEETDAAEVITISPPTGLTEE